MKPDVSASPPPAPHSQTNPVFAYRAGFRNVAHRVQSFSMLLGLVLLIGGGTGALFAAVSPRLQVVLLSVCGAGAALLAGGIAWGFIWRIHLRNCFRREYGLPAASSSEPGRPGLQE